MKLHIGCGSKNFGNNWIHIDGSHYSHIKYHDIKHLEFEDHTIDLIYACHVLEYFDRDEVKDVLKEWKRCLKPEGVIRLAVPNFSAMAKLYVEKSMPLSCFIGPLYGKWTMTTELTIYHKTVYDFYSLKKILNITGFKNVRYWDWKNTIHSDFDDYSQAYIPHMDKEHGTLISLNVEANK